jgi:hypothetical protein
MRTRCNAIDAQDLRLGVTPALLRAVCIVGFLVNLPLVAQAQIFEQSQLIDQYLNPTVFSTDIEPGVTVTSREHPEYNPVGIAAGRFVIQLSLLESFGFDDNVTGLKSGQGSPTLNTTASTSAVDKMSDGTIAFQGSVSDFEYPSVTRESYTTWTGSAVGTHQFGEDSLIISVTHYNMTETARELSVPQLDSPIDFRIEDLQAFYNFSLGGIQFQPGMDFSYYNFDNGAVGGVPYLQSYRDRFVYYPSITTKFEFAPRRDLLLVIRDADASYTHTVAGLPTQNFNDVSVMGGISYDVDGVIDFRLLGGYEQREFSSHKYRTIQAPILEGALVWTPTELTTVSATASRYITDTAAEGTIGETETTLKLLIDHELLRNVILHFKAGFGSAGYIGDRPQNVYSVDVGSTWKLNRWLRLGVDYKFVDRESSNVTIPQITQQSVYATAQSYTENVITLQIGVSY